MDNSIKRIHTLAVLVDNEAGVLSQVSRMFTRKGYNIESLAVGVTHDPTISRITIEVHTDYERACLLCNQLRKLLPVHSVKLLNNDNSIKRELLLIKVATPDIATRNEAVQLLDNCTILELVRTGIVALERGMNTIDEDTKEKGEFDYGKNVL